MLAVLCALRTSLFVSSFKMKQSSLLVVFSPMHIALKNKLTVDLGSRPCREIYITERRTVEECHAFCQLYKQRSTGKVGYIPERSDEGVWEGLW